MEKISLFVFLMLAVLGFSQDNFPGNTLSFDGSDDFVEVPDNATLDLVNNYTLEAWVQFNDFNSNEGIISKYQTLGANGYYLRLSSTSPYTGLSFDGLETANGILQSFLWYHIVAVNNNGNRKLYINGEEQPLSGTAENVVANNNSLCFGVDYLFNPRWFRGKIDEVRIWNIPLNETQIRKNMHFVLDGTESGLVSYWQFNESSGTVLEDIVGSNDGTLHNMEIYDWVSSGIPFGSGVNDIQTETNGNVVFNGTDLSVYYISQNGATVSVNRIDTIPNQYPNGMDTVFHNQYWAVNRYGTGTFSGEMTFEINEGFTGNDEEYPNRVKLFGRSLTSEEDWIELAQAYSIDSASNTILFSGINTVGQFIIAKDETSLIAIDQNTIDFGLLSIGDSLSLSCHISNFGEDTLSVSNISSNYSDFSMNITSFQVPPDGVQEIVITFKPQDKMFYQDTLYISSNAYNELDLPITLQGSSIFPKMNRLELPHHLELISNNFNGIDVGLHSKPCFKDINGNGLLDMFIGEEDGTIYRYEQDSENSTSFTFITSDFSSLDVGEYPVPAIADIDGDGLWDMIVGDKTGVLKHFEQDSENSLSFSLVTDNFNAIDVGAHSAPTFVDLDGDDLLDMMVGKDDGGINYYEQVYSNANTFSLHTENFNSIDVGSKATPAFTDLDGDGLLDLVIGEQSGNLNHYEQNSVHSSAFTWVDSDISAMDIGWNSAPSFEDMDDDGNCDLIIGDYFGKLRHYRQAKVDTVSIVSLNGLRRVEKYYIKASDLVGDLTIQSSSSKFMLSSSDAVGSFSSSLTLSPQNGKLYDTVYVFFHTAELGVKEGDFRHISTYMDTSYVYLHSTIYPADNYPGNALDFDSIDDYVKCEMKPEITGSHARSIEAWAYTRSFNEGGIFQTGITGSTNRDFSLRTLSTDNRWRMQFWGYDYDLTLPDSKDSWHHYCMTYDETNVKLYYDGKLMKSLSKNLDTGDGDIYFGKWRDYYFDGKIDEIRIWDVALDSIQIRENMHLNLPGSNNGLLSYWQFDEESGNLLQDIADRQYDTLMNMSNEDWVSSAIAFGNGNSDTHTETNGNVHFGLTNLDINYISQSGASVTVTRIDTIPNLNPTLIDEVFDDQYWVIHRYGSGDFEAEMSFKINETLSIEDANKPGRIKLFWREANSESDWEEVADADVVDVVNNTASFSGLTKAGEYILGRLTSSRLALEQLSIDFGKVNLQDSLTLNFKINNIGFDTLYISDILSSNPEFFTNLTTIQVLPGEGENMALTFKPQARSIRKDTLWFSANAINGNHWTIPLFARGVTASIVTVDNQYHVKLISGQFSNIDPLDRAKPIFEDIDGDELWDLIIGDESNTLRYYEQDSINSNTFSLVTDHFLTVNGHYLNPTFTDLDGDELLDLFIGKENGTIDYYEQDSVHSTSFNLAIENFNSMDVGSWAVPTFADFDGDGLLDLLIGELHEFLPNMNYYKQDSIHSTSFTLITDDFCNSSDLITSEPVLADVNGDGLLDLFISHSEVDQIDSYGGKISYYQQDSSNSTTFSLMSDSFSGNAILEPFPTLKDIDNDGLMDFFVTPFSYTNIWHYEQVALDTLFFNTPLTNQKVFRKYNIKAKNLVEPLKLQCDSGNYSISLYADSAYTQTLEIEPVDRQVMKTIYVRYTPHANASDSARIMQTSILLDTTYMFLDRCCGEIAGHPGKALDLSGRNGYLSCETGGEIGEGKEKTIDMWAYVDNFDGGGVFQAKVIHEYDTENKYVFNLCTTETANKWKIENKINNSNTGYYGETFTLPECRDGWHHYSITFDGSRMKMYFDGKLYLNKQKNLYHVDDTLIFGKRDNDYFDGKLDEIRIWNYAMDSTEVREKMHLSPDADEEGLLSYWQCNENKRNRVYDVISSYDFTMHNIDASSFIPSPLSYGKGCSTSETEVNGLLSFGETGLSLDYLSQSGASVTVSRVDTLPNRYVEADTTYSCYWVVDRYGTGSFSADIILKLEEDLKRTDPQHFWLYRREKRSDSAWTKIAGASSVDTTNNTVRFEGIEEDGQFLVVKNWTPRLAFIPNPIDYEYENIGGTIPYSAIIRNVGDDTLFVSDLSNATPDFSINSSLPFQLLPGEEQEIEVVFKPTEKTIYQDTIFASTNASGTLYTALRGEGVRSSLLHLALPYELEEIDLVFNNIDIGLKADPTIIDIDGDQLLDLVIGKGDGTIALYEQDSIHSLSFSLITENFNAIDVGGFAAPTFTDFNHDGLLDLIIGRENKYLYYYVQDSLNSYTFNFVTDKFNSNTISYQISSTPCFIDVDGDSLLDLYIGDEEGEVSHYVQNGIDSTSFSKVSIDFLGYKADPNLAFCDLEGDGLLDVVMGVYSKLELFSQDSENSNSFSLITDNFGKINAPSYNAPEIVDLDDDRLLDLLLGKNDGTIAHYIQKEVDSLSFGHISPQLHSQKMFLILGKEMDDEITIESGVDCFELSTSENSGFVQFLKLTISDKEIIDTVYVRFSPNTEGLFSTNLKISVPGMDTSYIYLEGAGKFPDNYPGNVLDFDGNNDFVDIADNASIDLVNNYTLEAWIKPSSFGPMRGIISKYHTSNANGYFLRLGNTSPYTGIGFDGLETEVGILQANQWYHIAAVNNNGARKLYVNGKEQNLNGSAQTIKSNTDILRIGMDYMANPRWFNGEIDEIRIWNIALDSTQIRENMHLNLSGNETGLVSYWQFNEDFGNKLFDIISGNDGTLQNMEADDWVASTIPFGGGDSDSQMEANGNISFVNTNLDISYNSQSGANITASRIDTIPNINPPNDEYEYPTQYWVIHRYGSGNFDADLTFTLQEDLTIDDENNPNQIKLFTRGSTADTAWAQIAEASSVNAANNTATFSGISEFSQFIIGREVSRLNVEIIAYLEGAMNGTLMDTTLNNSGLLPFSQPFNTSPWNYSGTESVSAIPATDIVDWVLIELRDTTDVSLATPQTMLAQKAVFIKKDGNIVDTDGTINPILFENVKVQNNLYVVLWHRNHLGIISAVPLIKSNGVYSYDFSTAISQAYLSGQKLINGKAAMIGGDLNSDGTIDDNDHIIWKTKAGETGYHKEDATLDTETNNEDKNDVVVPNTGSSSNIPE